MDLLAAPGPRWFTIPAHRPFVDDLAAGLIGAFGADPQSLADCTVLTPTRRGARALAEGFVGAGGGRAVLLPQILALGDLDEGEPPFEPGDLALDLPPAVSPMRRRFELARLVAEHQDLFERRLDAAGALELAEALAALLDSMQIEEVEDPTRIAALVEGDLARHWQRSAEFLAIATEAWPRRLAELGLMDVTQRRAALLRALAEQWTAEPPQRPLIAAGSTGTAPATADLLRVIAAAPQGAVVLPGLDLDLADSAWDQVGEAHPQGAMRRLLARAGVARQGVRPWPCPEPAADAARGRSRRRVINEALRPAEATADWVEVIAQMRGEGVDPIAEGLEGLHVVTARTEEDAAGAAALLLREALETPGKTAALVTPDPALARRVSARLSRWGIAADSSAGAALSTAPAGVLMSLVAGASADPLDPVRALAILKHPLVRLGRDPETLSRARRTLEAAVFRGARAPDREVMLQRLEAQHDEARSLLTELFAALDLARSIFSSDAPETPVPLAARALAEAMEALARQPAGGTGSLWAGAAGESAAGLITALMDEADGLPPGNAARFAALVERLVAAQVVRTGGAAHPRLRILGAIEARLIRADRLVLAGLEEGVWPRVPDADPFLSRPMREKLGLPPPERRIGLAAHDFAQAACAPEVVLVHVERRDGQPAVKSRWLWRLETLAKGAGLSLPTRQEALAWSRALDAPLADPPPALAPARPPEPRPPLEARPRQLSVTQVETWVRDPYSVYARHVLKLQPLPPPDERVEVRIRGTAIHTAFERLSIVWPGLERGREGQAFAEFYVDALRAKGATEASLAREQILAFHAGEWVAELERRRRRPGVDIAVEQRGTLRLEPEAFTVTARADRLEIDRDHVHVLDFKTGRAPTAREIETGFSPQLTLTAAIFQGGGFAGVGAKLPGELLYVRVTGREPAGEEHLRGAPGESEMMAAQALDGLRALVARYDDPAYPYRSRIAPRFVKTYASDYDHLARVAEWSPGDDEDDG